MPETQISKSQQRPTWPHRISELLACARCRTRPCARPLSTRPQGTGLQRSSLKVVCKVASQHSHLGEAIADWQQFQQRPPREERHHHHQKHVYHNKHHANTMTTTLPKPQHALERIHQSFIPHLDGRTVDPTDVLMWLREYLLLEPNTRHSAVVTAEETGESLLDLGKQTAVADTCGTSVSVLVQIPACQRAGASHCTGCLCALLFLAVSVLVLLDEDLKSEEQGATLVFQPVLDIRNKVRQRTPKRTPKQALSQIREVHSCSHMACSACRQHSMFWQRALAA